MSNLQELKVTERDTTLTPRQLRTAGFIPATVYGHGVESQNIQVRNHEFHQLYMHGTREFQLTGFVSGMAKLQKLDRDPVTQKPFAIELHINPDSKGRQATKKNVANQKAEADKALSKA
jgi:ribosomal protein L25 (general stress protein Ctc)